MIDDDAQLLRRYAEENSEAAFTALVQRHVNLVYSAALRQVGGDAHHAHDVAQMVFTDLARKASRLSRHTALIGWLYTSTHYAAAKVVRSEQRRKQREQHAHAMNEPLGSAAEPRANWEELRPVLDHAMQGLRARERNALLLRFCDRRSLAEVGRALGISENAAQKTAERALEKLRTLLVRQGVTSTASALTLVLTEQTVLAAPVGLATALSGAALGAAGSTAAGGGAWAALFVMSKIQFSIAAAVLLALAGTAVVEVRANRSLHAALRAQPNADAALVGERHEHERLVAALHASAPQNPEVPELARAQARVAQLVARPPGVLDALMKPVANVGRGTPEAAFSTLCAAINAGDLDAAATVIGFRGEGSGSPEVREAFWAKFPASVRARFQTPERLAGAALFGIRDGVRWSNPVIACQPLTTEERTPFGSVLVQAWVRLADGSEEPSGEQFRRGSNGWTVELRPLSDPKLVALLKSHLDPVTGELLPRPPK